ncbi:MAG: RNA polymerase sigma factor SigZ [Betaproteobacteria bacterium]
MSQGKEHPMGCLTRAWRLHKNEIRGFVAHRLGNTAEADDLLQEVFLKGLLQGKAFCSLNHPRAWLFHVARNLLVDHLRLSREQVPLPDDLCAEAESSFEPVDILTHCLPRILSELAPEDREAITLCDLNGLSQQAYATRLGLSLPAAKSRVQRARQRLQSQLVKACQVKFDEAGKVCCFIPRPPLNPEE